MIEAVGPTVRGFFAAIDRVLAPGGGAAMQAILFPSNAQTAPRRPT